jgi:4-diphosphocytidyl-2-C-methyl-D-erythritol kinase
VTHVRVEAPAKVNLHLRILGRRPDGYHDLETLFQAIDLRDVLDFERGGAGIELEVDGEDVGPAADILVKRAALAFLAAAGRISEGVRIRLEKRIPSGAGLGGGSSDAAATLRAMDALFPGAVPPGRITAIAVGLGSDVPFFLGASPLAVGRGRGESLEPIEPLPRAAGIVVMPNTRVPTAHGYRGLARSREGGAPQRSDGLPPTADWDRLSRSARNDFEAVVAAQFPEAGDALMRLRATDPMLALLSGSGAASFALYRSEEAATRAEASLDAPSAARVFPVHTLEAWPAQP